MVSVGPQCSLIYSFNKPLQAPDTRSHGRSAPGGPAGSGKFEVWPSAQRRPRTRSGLSWLCSEALSLLHTSVPPAV